MVGGQIKNCYGGAVPDAMASGVRQPGMRWRRGQVRTRRLFNRLPLGENQKLHLLTFVIGGLCGLAAVAFHWLLEFLQNGIIYRLAGAPGPWRPIFLILVPALGGLVAGATLYFYAPEARGSGIPQVKAAFLLEGGRIPARVIPAKMLLSALNIGTGASLGREGPTVQICAAIASLLGRIFDLSRERLRSLVPVGAAAGLAAAFNTPIAAVTFTLEEILGDTAAKPLGSIVIASVIASVVERSLLGEHALFSVPAYRLNSLAELPFYLLLGVLAGMAASAFNVSLLRLRGWFQAQPQVPAWATPGAGGLVVGVLGLSGLLLTGSASVFGVGYQQLAGGLQGGMPLKLLLILGAFKLAATVVSYSSGSAGGIFGPSLYIGGMIGGVVGILASVVLGPNTQAGAFVLVGMGALFAGIVRAPITSIVIIFEMTSNYSVILPLMAANIASYAVARRLSPMPIYDALLRQDGIQLPQAGGHHLKRLRASAAMTRDPVTLDARWTVAEANARLRGSNRTHLAYPIIDAEGRFVGMLSVAEIGRALDESEVGTPIAQLARLGVAYGHPDHTLETVLATLGRTGAAELPVVSRKDTTRLLGVVTLRDVASALARAANPDGRDT
jgi:CIC family chloride channel protein